MKQKHSSSLRQDISLPKQGLNYLHDVSSHLARWDKALSRNPDSEDVPTMALKVREMLGYKTPALSRQEAASFCTSEEVGLFITAGETFWLPGFVLLATQKWRLLGCWKWYSYGMCLCFCVCAHMPRTITESIWMQSNDFEAMVENSSLTDRQKHHFL